MLDEDSEGLIGIHCSPSCGNDIVQAFYLASVPTSSQIPEPGTSLVWLTGVGAIAALRLRQKRRTAKSISKKLFMAPLTRLRATMPGHMPNTLMGKYYSQRSGNNGASNIITEATNVSDTATGYYAEPGIFTEIQEFEWKKIIDLVHSKGSKIWCQLWHVGRVSHFSLQPNGNKPISATSKRCSNLVPIDSSMKRVPCSEPRSIETGEIVGLVNSFKQAAIRAKNAGFEGLDDLLVGQIGVAFSEDDPTAPARVIKKFIKDKNPLDVVGILFEGQMFDAAKYEELASLPSREELITDIIGMVGSQGSIISNLVGSPGSNIAGIVSNIEEKKAA